MDEAMPLMDQLFGAALGATTEPTRRMVQETYLKAYQKFHQYKPGTSIKASWRSSPQHLHHQPQDQRSPKRASTDTVELAAGRRLAGDRPQVRRKSKSRGRALRACAGPRFALGGRGWLSHGWRLKE